MPLDLSVVIPIYNAETIVDDTVERLVRAVDLLGINYEILLKSDGSLDRSSQRLEEIGRRYNHVKCFSSSTNEGLGTTLQDLFNRADGDVIVYCDCDLPFGEKIISMLLSEIESNDCVVASRYCGMRNHVPLIRKISSRLYFYLCKLLFNIPVCDIGSGSVAIRKKVLDKLNLKARGFSIHTELFVKTIQNKYLIKEIPAESFRIDTSSFRIWKHGLPTLCETIALWSKKL